MPLSSLVAFTCRLNSGGLSLHGILQMSVSVLEADCCWCDTAKLQFLQVLLFWLPFSTPKAACIAAISDRRVLSSANAEIMSGDSPLEE